MSSDEFIELLAGLANAGSCIRKQRGITIEFDARFDLTIEISESGHQAYFHAPVLMVPSENRDALFALALQLHMFGLATDGNSFGYDMKRGRLILFRVLDLPNLAVHAVPEFIESFVNQLERWTHHFSQIDGKMARSLESGMHLHA